MSPILRDYLSLTKPRKLARLAAFIAFAIAISFPTRPGDWRVVGLASIGGFLAAGAANVLNMYFDRESDATRPETRARPLADRRLAPVSALVFAALLGSVGIAELLRSVNSATALVAVCGVALYGIVYSRWVKRATPYYALVGGLAWAVPVPFFAAALGVLNTSATVWAFLTATLWTVLHVWSSMLAGDRHAVAPSPVQGQPLEPGVQRFNLFIVCIALAAVSAQLMLALDSRASVRPLLAIVLGAGLVALAGVAMRRQHRSSDRLLSRAAMGYVCSSLLLVLLR